MQKAPQLHKFSDSAPVVVPKRPGHDRIWKIPRKILASPTRFRFDLEILGTFSIPIPEEPNAPDLPATLLRSERRVRQVPIERAKSQSVTWRYAVSPFWIAQLSCLSPAGKTFRARQVAVSNF